MKINTDLLLQIREQITAHPETHDQDQWGRRTECGTTHCIAGWAAVLSGANLDWRKNEFGVGLLCFVNEHDPGVYAAALLGLSCDEAGALFYQGNKAALTHLDELIEKGKNAA